MNSVRGVVMLAVLFFLQAFALLGSVTFWANMLYLKSIREAMQRDKDLLNANYILHNLRQGPAKMNACVVARLSAGELIERSEEWWMFQGCHITMSGTQYDVIWESLGRDPCAIVENSANNQNVIAQYWRVTLHHSRMLLQRTWVHGISSIEVCVDKKHVVHGGYQMQRQLFS